MTLNPSRRNFLKGSAAISGGLALGFNFDVLAQGKAAQPIVVPEANAWVVVRPDNTIIIRYARAEMGQGSMTSAPMLMAEELEADWSKVKVEYARANEQVKRKRAWGDMAAVGSRTIRNSQEYLRKAGAGAREMLVTAAAARWKVPASECVVANSVITHTPSGRKFTYGQVALDAAKVEAPKDPKIKDRKISNWSASQFAGSTSRTSSPARSGTVPTHKCPACCMPRSLPARCSAGK